MGDATGALSIDGVEKCDEGAVRVLIFVLTLSFFDLGCQDRVVSVSVSDTLDLDLS